MSRPGSIWLTLASTVVFALLVAAGLNRGIGLLIGGLLGYLLAQRLQFAGWIEALEARIRTLEAEATRPAPAPAAIAPVPRPAPAPAQPAAGATAPVRPAAAPPTAAPPAAAEAPADERPAWQAPPSPPKFLPPSALETFINDAGARAIAWIKGGNPLARVGIVILFFGGAFLAKYASDHAMLPLELRLAALAGGAIVLLVLGWRLRTERSVYAQILQGGGVAGLYLTVFAATRLYHLLPHSFALPLLIVTALASALLAVVQSSLALAVIGFAGGFLAPVLLATGGGSHIALFTYYAVLNLGVFTVAWFRAWRVLNLVGFAFTFGITGAWRASSYVPEQLASADFFLLLFFLMYVAISILFALRQKPDLRGYVSASLVFGLPVVVFSLHASYVSRIEYGLAYSALGFGLFYLGLAWTLFVTRRDTFRLLAEAFAALGVIFTSLAIPLAFDRQTTAAMWAVEGAGLLWLGIRQDRKLARAFGALLQLSGGIGYFAKLGELQAATPVLNSAYIGTLLAAIAGALSARWLQKNAATRAAYETGAESVAALWATWWWWYGGLAEIARHAPAGTEYGASLAFAAAAIVVVAALAKRWQWPLLAQLAMAEFALAAVFGVLAGVRHSHPFADYGWAGWALLLATGYWLLHWLDREPDDLLTPLRPLLHGGSYVLLALLAAWELHWQIERSVPGVWADLPIGLVPAALAWAATPAQPRPAWPLARHRMSYLLQGGVPLLAFAALWLLLANLGNAGDPAWLPYLPLLNPLDIASLLVLLVLAHWRIALAGSGVQLPARPFWIALAALGFVWLNAALIRALHYGFDTPLDASGIRHSFLVQASLSIFWSLLGLAAMSLAAKRMWRPIWIAGAALMGAVVLKLFAVDLEGTGSLARIISFLSVGALLLAAGYLSPLPPSSIERTPP